MVTSCIMMRAILLQIWQLEAWDQCMVAILVAVVIIRLDAMASTLYTAGGSGIYGFSSMLVYITRKNGKFFRQYGRVLHDNSIVGVKPEGKVSVTFTEIKCSFPDGETYSLIRPHYSVSEWYADSIKPEVCGFQSGSSSACRYGTNYEFGPG